ncbi:hypothetical protein MMC17_004864 [Xylographa soralifera]|nr:hypothetical protein [Xylographa soralifera]
MSTHEEMLGLSQEAWDRLNPRETSLLVLAEGESPVSIDIIFVHGMLGDRKSTWTKDNILWPRDLLPQQLKHARIMTWGYQSSSKSISNHGMQLLNDIGKPEDDPERPIILVGHSTGGLVVKEALLYGGITRNGAEMFLTPEEIHRGIPTLWTRIAGVIFMATPHHGITKTKLAKMIASITDTRMQASEKRFRALDLGSEDYLQRQRPPSPRSIESYLQSAFARNIPRTLGG